MGYLISSLWWSSNPTCFAKQAFHNCTNMAASLLHFLHIPEPLSFASVLRQGLTNLLTLAFNSLCNQERSRIGEVLCFTYFFYTFTSCVLLSVEANYHLLHSCISYFCLLPYKYLSLVLHDPMTYLPLPHPEKLPKRLILRLWDLVQSPRPFLILAHWLPHLFFLSTPCLWALLPSPPPVRTVTCSTHHSVYRRNVSWLQPCWAMYSLKRVLYCVIYVWGSTACTRVKNHASIYIDFEWWNE